MSLDRGTYYHYNSAYSLIRVTESVNQAKTEYLYHADNVNVRASVGPRFASGVNEATYFNYNSSGAATSVVRPLGFTRTFPRDALGRVVKEVDARNAPTYFNYHAVSGLLRSAVDAQNNAAYFKYDPFGNRRAVVSPRWRETGAQAGWTSYYIYDQRSRAHRVTNALSQSTYFDYTGRSDLLAITDARGVVTQSAFNGFRLPTKNVVKTAAGVVVAKTYFSYDRYKNKYRQTNGRGYSTYFAYDVLDRPVLISNALSGQASCGYDSVGNRVKIRNPRAYTTYFVHDKLNRLTGIVDGLNNNKTYFGYDLGNNVVKARDARSNTTTHTYDAAGRRILSVDPRNGQTYFGYDANDNLVKLRDARGKSAIAVIDSQNRVTTVTDAQANVAYFGYNAAGQRVKIRDMRSNTTVVKYDVLNRPILVTDPLANATYFGYDQVGNLVKKQNGLQHRIQATYDAVNRPVTIINGAGQSAYFGYDLVGNVVKSRDQLGNTKALTYDALNRLSQISNPLLQTTTFAYDAVGNRVKDVDALLRATYFTYDALNRLIYIVDPLNQRTYFVYDATSNLTQSLVQNASFKPVIVGYDALNRKTKATTGLMVAAQGYGTQAYGTTLYGGVVGGARYSYFAYDSASNLTGMLDDHGVSSFGYDAINRLAKRVFPRMGTAYFVYDGMSNRTALQYPAGSLQARAIYDALNRQSALLSPDSKATYFVYDQAANLSKRRFGNAAVCYYRYDANERVTAIRHLTSAGAPIATMDYQRDVGGRIVKIARETDLAIYYQYDKADRLVKELWAKKSTSAQIYAFSYLYDAAGNRLKSRRESQAGIVTESSYFTYNAASAATKRWVTPANVATYYRYDAAGNVTRVLEGTKGTYFEYALSGFVSKIIPPIADGQPWQFGYDGLLNRVKIVKGATSTYYAWDGMNQLEERDAAGNLIARYTHGPGIVPNIGSVAEVRRQTATTTYFQYLHMDHQGSVQKVSDVNQATQLAYVNDAFGRHIVAPSGANPLVANDLQFQSNWLTVTIGTKRYGLSPSRVYDFEQGRFLQVDRMPDAIKLVRGARQGNGMGVLDRTIFSAEIAYQSRNPYHLVGRYGPDYLFNAWDASGFDGGIPTLPAPPSAPDDLPQIVLPLKQPDSEYDWSAAFTAYAGGMFECSGVARDEYNFLKEFIGTKEERTYLKDLMRTRTPQPMAAFVYYMRPGLGPKEGKLSNPKSTNANWNTFGTVCKWGGRALVVGSVVSSTYEVVTAEDTSRALVVAGGTTLGGVGGGWGGAAAGAAIGSFIPGAGTLIGGIIGGILGSIGGGYVGGTAGGATYNAAYGP